MNKRKGHYKLRRDAIPECGCGYSNWAVPGSCPVCWEYVPTKEEQKEFKDKIDQLIKYHNLKKDLFGG